jgi:hypothetical protein
MKNLITVVYALILCAFTVLAQAPEKINYQGVARDLSGNVLPNQAVGLQIKIHSGTGSGTVGYQETHAVSTNAFGLFNVQLGGGTVQSGTFSTIGWASNLFYVEVLMDATGGTTYTSMGTQQLVSVPYALNSKTTGSISGTTNYVPKFTPDGNTLGNSQIFDNGTNVGIGTTSNTYKFHVAASSLTTAKFESTTNPLIAVAEAGTNKAYFQMFNDEFYISTYGTRALKIGTNSSADITVDANGNVGIGTTTPLYKLHADQPLSSGTAITAINSYVGNADGTGVTGSAVNNPYYGTGINGIGGYVGTYGYGNGSTATQSVYGVYGQAMGSAGTRYGVYGSASGGTTNYGVYCNGSGGYTGTWALLSDRKFKTDLAPVSEALALVNKLNPVSYQLKTKEFPMMNFPEARQYGFVAQELEEVIPLLVENGSHPGLTKEDEDIKLKAVNYIGMIPILTKAIQEQQLLIEKLSKEVELLKAK